MKQLHNISAHTRYLLFIAFMCLMGAPYVMQAQNNSTVSPYTRFGYGTLSSQPSTALRGLGGVAIGVRQSNIINIQNPASYSAVDSQTFISDVAASIGVSYLKQQAAHNTRMLGNLEYAAMLFPIYKGVAISAGIKPFSYVGYKFGDTHPLKGLDDATYTTMYSGVGNINDIYLGLGVAPFKGFSLGANAAFRFGSIVHERSLSYATSYAYNPTFKDELSVRGFNLLVGAQYQFAVNETEAVTFGSTYTPSLPLKSHHIATEIMASPSSAPIITQTDDSYLTNAYMQPHQIGVGASFSKKDKLLIAADVQYNIWNNTFPKSPFFTPQNQISFNIGTSFIPLSNDRSIWNRTEYRFGLLGSNSYFTIPTAKGTAAGYLMGGLTFGMGMPLVDKRSYVDFAIEYRHIMPRAKQMISENYFMLTVGLRFNEAWFKKLKID